MVMVVYFTGEMLFFSPLAAVSMHVRSRFGHAKANCCTFII